MRKPTSFHRTRLARIRRFLAMGPKALDSVVTAADARRCRTTDPEAFFPPDGTRFTGRALLTERARITRLCRGCPVRDQCLAAAVLRGENYGSWGGVAQPDIQILRRLWHDQPPTTKGAA